MNRSPPIEVSSANDSSIGASHFNKCKILIREMQNMKQNCFIEEK